MLPCTRRPIRTFSARCTCSGSWRCGALFSLLFLVGLIPSYAQTGSFTIWKGGERVGNLSVARTYEGDRIRYTMNSLSTVEVMLWTKIVRTALTAEYVGNTLEACGSSVHLNDVMQDSSSMRTDAGIAKGYVHPGRKMNGGNGNAWTTARMYYEEPVGQETIYVESVLGDRPLERLAPGVYRLLLPDGKVNRYVYTLGVLQEVQVDRTFFDLVFRRI